MSGDGCVSGTQPRQLLAIPTAESYSTLAFVRGTPPADEAHDREGMRRGREPQVEWNNPFLVEPASTSTIGPVEARHSPPVVVSAVRQAQHAYRYRPSIAEQCAHRNIRPPPGPASSQLCDAAHYQHVQASVSPSSSHGAPSTFHRGDINGTAGTQQLPSRVTASSFATPLIASSSTATSSSPSLPPTYDSGSRHWGLATTMDAQDTSTAPRPYLGRDGSLGLFSDTGALSPTVAVWSSAQNAQGSSDWYTTPTQLPDNAASASLPRDWPTMAAYQALADNYAVQQRGQSLQQVAHFRSPFAMPTVMQQQIGASIPPLVALTQTASMALPCIPTTITGSTGAIVVRLVPITFSPWSVVVMSASMPTAMSPMEATEADESTRSEATVSSALTSQRFGGRLAAAERQHRHSGASTSPPRASLGDGDMGTSPLCIRRGWSPRWRPTVAERQPRVPNRPLHECDICARYFSTTSSLVRHRRIHTNDRKFKCSWADCTSAFTDATNCKRHEATHQRTASASAKNSLK